MTRRGHAEGLEAEITSLGDLEHSGLKDKFRKLTGSSPPKHMGRKLLILAIAYELQRRALRVRTDRLNKRLSAFDVERGRAPDDTSEALQPQPLDAKRDRRTSRPRRRVRPGGRLIREWQGRTYEVFVAEDACYVDGEKFRSLSAAATAITGVKRNGPAFFGLRSPRVSA